MYHAYNNQSWVNSRAHGKCDYNLQSVIFKLISRIDILGISCEIVLRWIPEFHWWLVNIGSGNGLVLSGNKPWPELMLTQICVRIRHHRPQWVKWVIAIKQDSIANAQTPQCNFLHCQPLWCWTRVYWENKVNTLDADALPPSITKSSAAMILSVSDGHVLPHDDVIKLKHFPCYWPFVWGIHQSLLASPHEGQWRRALIFSLICVWVNNREAGDLRYHCPHYDVTVMLSVRKVFNCLHHLRWFHNLIFSQEILQLGLTSHFASGNDANENIFFFFSKINSAQQGLIQPLLTEVDHRLTCGGCGCICAKACSGRPCSTVYGLLMMPRFNDGMLGDVDVPDELLLLTPATKNGIFYIFVLFISFYQKDYDVAEQHTVETLYNTVNFCWSTHKRHSIARPKGRGMGCLLWVQRATYCVDLSKLSSIKYLL